MFFRQTKTPSGVVLQLIQSFRNQDDKPRQRIIVSLGNADIPEPDRPIIASRISFLLSNQVELIPEVLTTTQASWVDRILKLIQQKRRRALADIVPASLESTETFPLDSVEHSHSTPAGAEILGLHAWDQLEISNVLRQSGFNDAQLRCAKAVVINRLVDSVTEHALPLWLQNKSSLPDLLGESFAGSHIQGRFYRINDLLYKQAGSLELHLRERQEALFGQRPAIYLYDLTNTYFEGTAKGNEEAKRGHSKEKRNDCPLISLAIAYSVEGMPLGHRIFAGNQSDSASFPVALSQMQQEWASLCRPEQKPLFVMDAGIATAGNLRLLRSLGYDYLVCEKRTLRTARANEFSDKDAFLQIQDKGVFVKHVSEQCSEKLPIDPTQKTSELISEVAEEQEETWQESVLYCYSEQREEKEKAIHDNAEKRFLVDVEKLRKRIERQGFKDLSVAERALGRIQERNRGVSRFYELAFTIEKEPANPEEENQIDLSKKKQGKKSKKKAVKIESLSCERKSATDGIADLYGTYCLRSTRSFKDGSEMWHLYTQLTNAEDGFRCLKTDLGLRPVHHQTNQRVRAHIFISILALHLLCYIKRKLLDGGYPAQTWETLKTILHSHSYTTLSANKGAKTYSVRKPGLPGEVQKKIYEIFGIKIKELPRTRFELDSPVK